MAGVRKRGVSTSLIQQIDNVRAVDIANLDDWGLVYVIVNGAGIVRLGRFVTFASPKSRTFACPRLLTKILAGLMSL